MYIGGRRARLNHMAMYEVIKDGLTELGWMDDDREHMSVTVTTEQVDRDETVEPNIVVVAPEDVDEMDMELGSNLAEHRWIYYIDIYAEKDSLGLHLATDIRDLLKGRFSSSVSRRGPNITVYDRSVSSATPIELWNVELENVTMDRSRFYEQPHEKHWWVIQFTLVDEYDTEEDE